MKEAYYIFVPTITPDVETLNEEILKNMALDLNSDFATLKQVFSGSGIGILRRTTDKKLALNLVSDFKKFKIPFAAVSLDVLSAVPVINAYKIKIREEGFTVIDTEGKSNDFNFDKITFVGSDSGISKVNFKNSMLKSKQFAIAFENAAICIDTELVNYENLPNLNKYSKLNNTIGFIQLLEEKSKEMYLDKSYNSLKMQLDDDFKLYCAVLSKAVKKELYKGVPEKYFHVKKDEIKKQISYNYTIYRGMALLKRKLKINKNKTLLSPFNYLVNSGFLFCIFAFYFNFPLIFILGTALLTTGYVLHFFKLSKIKNLILDIPTSKLRSVSAGLVEIKGRITSKEVFISPISGAECVFFRYKKLKRVQTRNGDHWNVSEIGEAIPSKCYLEDGTGLIGLNMKNADIKVKNPEKYTATYKEMEMGFHPSLFSGVKYEEEIIQTGESIYVMGTARPENKSAQFGSFLSDVKKNPANISRFDIDGNGVLDEQEWELAVPELKNEFRKKSLEQGQSSTLILDRDKDSNLLIVATEKEENLLKKIKWRVPLYLFLAIISFIFFIFSIISSI